MNRKIFIVLSLILFLFTTVSAQKVKPRFSTINSAGVLIGENHPELLLQSVNGIKYNDWFVGIGVGVDQYEIVSLPLFLDVRMDFGDDKKGFVYGDIGHNYFLKDTRKNDFPNFNASFKYSGGLYTDIGVGLRVSFMKKIKMVVSIGHSYKKINQIESMTTCPFIGPCFDNITDYNYSFGRFNLKVGLAL